MYLKSTRPLLRKGQQAILHSGHQDGNTMPYTETLQVPKDLKAPGKTWEDHC